MPTIIMLCKMLIILDKAHFSFSSVKLTALSIQNLALLLKSHYITMYPLSASQCLIMEDDSTSITLSQTLLILR